MSDETNGNGRLDRIEAALEKLTEAHLKHEFAAAKRHKQFQKDLKAMREVQAGTQKRLDYLTQLASIFADCTVELEEKAQRVKDAL